MNRREAAHLVKKVNKKFADQECLTGARRFWAEKLGPFISDPRCEMMDSWTPEKPCGSPATYYFEILEPVIYSSTSGLMHHVGADSESFEGGFTFCERHAQQEKAIANRLNWKYVLEKAPGL